MSKGVTLIEVIVCVAIFAILSVSIYGLFTSIINGIAFYRDKATVSFLADNYLEIVRNMPYSQIGTIAGNPHGNLADLPNPIISAINGTTYQIYYAVSYVDDPSDGTALLGTDLAANDYKQIKLYIKNNKTNATDSFFTNVSPKGLEGLASGGALSLKVFNSVGARIPGAKIHITNTTVVPNIDLTRTADGAGNWVEVGLPPSANSYHISASKTDYSTDSTYPITAQNQNPSKPDATVLNGQVTQISFSIDRESTLVFKTLSRTCAPISGVGVEVQGLKLIGTSPNVLKFDNTYTSNFNGQISLNNIEWDAYEPSITGNDYMLYGSSPILPINLLPNTSQNSNIILGPKTADSLLAVVTDAQNGNPIEGAEVDLQPSGEIRFTSGSIWSQQDWSGDVGQADFIDATKYFEDDGNINNNGTLPGLRLAKIGETYLSFGSLTSSTFDTGTDASTYTTLSWQPISQDTGTAIKFQLAGNNDDLTWNYTGPDGTDNTYYSDNNTTIKNENHNRYIRYKVFLSTTDPAATPVLSSVNVNYMSGCSVPGQAMFAGLQGGTYQATVSMDGYQTQVVSVGVDGYTISKILLSH